MLYDHSILKGAYLNDLLAQPRALADTAVALQRLPALPSAVFSAQRIVLTGMGSSLYALYPLQIRLIQAGKTAMMIETAELVFGQSRLLDEKTLVVAVSQSGQSAETVLLLDLVRAAAKRPLVIGVTNTLDSPLAKQSDFVVPLVAGAEFSVSCKTYLATLLSLNWLAVQLCGDRPEEQGTDSIAGVVDCYLQSKESHVDFLVNRLSKIRHLFITGRGASLAAVSTGALILKESTRFHAEGMSCPAFRHGPLEMVSPGLLAAVFSGDLATAALNQRLVRDIEAAGGQTILISEQSETGVSRLPKVPSSLRPIVEMLPIQMMSLALAVLAGREPGVFERASKITATE
jgi:glucosamine--fructose-6-phosphate aminotransferase (isomerizing)